MKNSAQRPLDFLDKNIDYKAVIYCQDENDLKIDQVNIRIQEVDKSSVVSLELEENSGAAIMIRKQ